MITYCVRQDVHHYEKTATQFVCRGIERLTAGVEPVEAQVVTVNENSKRHAVVYADGSGMNVNGQSGNSVANFFRIMFDFVSLWLCGVLYFLREFVESHRKPTGISSRKGEVAIVTGGGRGIGLEVAKQLLAQGMHVILASSNTVNGNSLLEELRKQFPQGKVEYLRLDLSSLASVRNFAKNFLDRNIPLHVLVNNAGIMFGPYVVTEDGFESHFEINYLGHFLLTYLLLPRLKEAGTLTHSSRVINVTSCVHFSGHIKFDDLLCSKYYSAHGCYAQSKLAQVMSTFVMQEMLDKEGANVKVNVVHPGIVNTKLYQYSIFDLAPLVTKMLFKTPEQGADTIAYLALSDNVEGMGGRYYENCKEAVASKRSYDRKAQLRLWEMTCDMLKLHDLKL